MTTTKAKPKSAIVSVVCIEIFCPRCDRSDPIPTRDGSFMWDSFPASVTCPDCREESRLPKTCKID